MFAVIKTGGKQFRVKEGDILDVEKLDFEEGKKVTFDNVLLIEDDKNTLIGTPVVEKAQVVGEVVENFKDKKVLVFKKKRRKQYRKTAGHRQILTRVKIEKILTGLETPAKKKPAEKKLKPEEELKKLEAEVVKKKAAEPAAKKEPVKTEANKVEPKKAKPAKPKTEPAKAAATKKKTAAAKPKKPTSKKEK
jgi:large subunit ribosomal protein L21